MIKVEFKWIRRILINFIIISFFLLFLFRDELKRSELDMVIFENFSNVITNDCTYNDDGFIVNGIDSYIMIPNINTDMVTVDIKLVGEDESNISMYYDMGYGFSESKCQTKEVMNNKVHFDVERINIKNLRFDFNEDVKIESVIINNEFNMLAYMMFFSMMLFVGFVVINVFFLRKNKEIQAYICLLPFLLVMYCFKYCILVKLPLNLIIATLIIVILIIIIAYLFYKETKEDQENCKI